MSKKILVISTSLRNDSNSEGLADSFIKGAQEQGNRVEKVTLKGKKMTFCRGCLQCHEQHKCVINDDAIAITQKMHDADVIVFATPIYYYEMSGQMKTLLDRSNALYGSDYAFQDVYLLMSAADDETNTPERTINGLTGWIDCFPRARLAGHVFAGGVNEAGEIKRHSALDKAYVLGRSAG